MASSSQKIMLGLELRTAISLLKIGLRELGKLDATNDFYHLPLLLLASGFERLMKTIICCHHLHVSGKFPDRNIFAIGIKGHDLTKLLGAITDECFSPDYLRQVPSSHTDINYLKSDKKLNTIIGILSYFGQGGRYYNLDVVLGKNDRRLSPDREWQKLEITVLQEDPNWQNKLMDFKNADAHHQQVNTNLTICFERMARSLCRLFTIGGLGDTAKQISPYAYDFLCLRDDQLGKISYESVEL